MSEIPHSGLSDRMQEVIGDRKVKAAVFLTFRFEPGFFEQEILPVFFDIGLSHVGKIRVVQMEGVLRDSHCDVAVYYDHNGLIAQGEYESARLDVRRFPVVQRAIFHPKNVFLLVANPGDDNTPPTESLVVASLSANLTRAGWWENVECCQIEELHEGELSLMPDSIEALLDWTRKHCRRDEEHTALAAVKKYLQRSTTQRQRRIAGGSYLTQFFGSKGSFPDFLRDAAGADLRGAYLEVISPYFTSSDDAGPLEELIDYFQPKETRVYLPRGPAGEALCNPGVYDAVSNLPQTTWGFLPKAIVKRSNAKDAVDRTVHAKVYRFFHKSPKREFIFVGSVNLTRAAHQSGGNTESGTLVETTPEAGPLDFWLTPETRKPKAFKPRAEDEGVAVSGGSKLSLRYAWHTGVAEAYWHDRTNCNTLRVRDGDLDMFSVADLPAMQWVKLPSETAELLRQVLPRTSMLAVVDDDETTGFILVQEEGMWKKPSVLLSLSVADILKYWSILDTDQRNAFLESRLSDLLSSRDGSELVAKACTMEKDAGVFAKFSGYFQAFSCLEKTIQSALEAKRDQDALFRLFGTNYDSLTSLLNRLTRNPSLAETPLDSTVAIPVQGVEDPVDRYIIALCARQMINQLRTATRRLDFWEQYKTEVRDLDELMAKAQLSRDSIRMDGDNEMPAFLEWFERWFLKRATPMESSS